MFYQIMCWALFSAFSVLAQVSIKKTKDAIIYDFEIDKLEFSKTKINNQYFNKINLVGVENYQAIKYSVGEPVLPVIRLLVESKPEIIYASDQNSIEGSLKALVAPAQAPRVKKPYSRNNFYFNKEIYNSSVFSPQKNYTIQEAGSIRGRKQYMLTLFPLSYAAKENKFKFIKNFKVKILLNKAKPETRIPTFAFIIPTSFKNNLSIKQFEDFKNKLGFKITKIYVNKNEKAESLRNKLKILYKLTNLRYALIFGDVELVPSKESTIISGVTDHYYRALDTDNYETDINGPDIGLGRISVKTQEDLEAVIKKYIAYEKGFFSEQNWLKGAAFLATNDQYEIAEGSHNYAIENYTKSLGFLGIFPNTVEAGGDKLYAVSHRANQNNVKEALGLGRAIINYSGHGATDLWDAPHMNQDDVRALKHGDATAFVISNACVTGQFSVDESFAETWQRHPHGAITMWASMDNTYWDEDDILEKKMYDGIFRDNLATFQAITENALKHLWLHYGGEGQSAYYWESYVLFGDPSQELRTDFAKIPILEGDRVLALGSEKVSYTVTDQQGKAIQNASITLMAPNKSLAFTTSTDEAGKAEIALGDLVREAVVFKVIIKGQNLVMTSFELALRQALAP